MAAKRTTVLGRLGFFSSVVLGLLATLWLVDRVLKLPSGLFWLLFAWRYTRQVVHLVAYCFYQPARAPPEPGGKKYRPDRDVTVVLPTMDPFNPDFHDCLVRCVANGPKKIIIATVGSGVDEQVRTVIRELLREQAPAPRAPRPKIVVAHYDEGTPNKRRQIAKALRARDDGGGAAVDTDIVVLMDDHVMWPRAFLATALLAFEGDSGARVGLVGTDKRVVRRPTHASLSDRVLNMVQCLYLERHNFEILASDATPGGAPFVVSGRTCLVRAAILHDADLLAAYVGERFFFRRLGPLAADDDNFLTRAVIERGWDIKIQALDADGDDGSRLSTSLGSVDKFAGGLIRWARTTWRSNSASLLTRAAWCRTPWNVYAVYLSSFTNFAAV